MQKEEGKVHPLKSVLSVNLLFCSSLFCPVQSYSDLICFILSLSVLSQSVLMTACRKKKERCTRFSLYCQLISFCSVFPCSVLSCPMLSCSDLIFPVLSCSDLICSVPSQSVLRASCMQKEEGKRHPLKSVLSVNLLLFCFSLFCPVLFCPVLT